GGVGAGDEPARIERSPRDRVSLVARSQRGRDGRRARGARRDGEIASVASDDEAPHGDRGRGGRRVSVERLSRMTDEELGEALRVLEPLLLQPEPPDVTGEVRAAIRAGRPPRRRLSSRARIVILIAAAVLAVATAAAAAKLVIDLGGIRIEREPTLTATPTGSPIAGVALGQPISLTAATTAAGFTPVVPRGLGTAERVSPPP